ncbi:MAG: hypothetical protein KDM63_15545, partial [Verrucomicrobiae bacterium]|nr:hypothetical protein [Verrucomicrobiae bacterium]
MIRQISLYLVLALAGYAAGRRFAKPPESEPAAPPIHSEGSASSGSIPRSAPSRATFAEMQPRLRELAEKRWTGWDPRSIATGARPGQSELEIESIFALANREELI